MALANTSLTQRTGGRPACGRRGAARLWLPALLLAVLVGGCASSSRYHITLTGDPMVDGPNAISNGPPRDRVLWQYRTAAAAMDRGLYAEAADYLDAALDRIENIYGYDKEARKARGVFSSEAKKTFIGEPYERVMAYYYRGILYWMNGQYGNARACFRSAQFMDSYAEDTTYASDYAVLEFLEAYTSAKLGDDTQSALQRAREFSRLSALPAFNPSANVFFFIQYGHGPVKFATGQYQEELRFRQGAPGPASAQLRLGPKTYAAPPLDDLLFQANTRGGRVMDHILANKAVFKASTDTLGTAALISGAILASDHDTEAAGLGLLAFGVLSKIVAASTTPEADVRMWDNLPQFLGFVPVQLPPGDYAASVDFLDRGGNPLGGLTKSVQFRVDGSGDTVVFVTEYSITPQSL